MINTWKRALRYSWLVALLPCAQGQSRTELVNPDDLKAALHGILSRNNLFDTAYLSDKLGIGLHISRPQPPDGDTGRFEGTATTTPPALYGSTAYEADVYRARQISTARLTFAPRSCPPVRQWSSEWHLQTRTGLLTDAAGSYESLVWPGGESIRLTVTWGARGWCSVEMSQTVRRVVSVQVSPELPKAPGDGLASQIADLLRADLRDYVHVGRILNTEFVVEPDAQRNGLLSRGRPFPGRVIPGFKSYVNYDGNDSGWYDPGIFFARPPHIADRIVVMTLIANSDFVCLSQPQLASELKKGGHRIRRQVDKNRDESSYSVSGANLVTVSVSFEHGCATTLHFRQVTDVVHSLGDPIRFTPRDSLERSTGKLTDEARRRIKLLVCRMRSVSWAGIEIAELPGERPTAAVTQELTLLRQLINEALAGMGVGARHRAKDDETGTCVMRLQPEGPAVCVDVWL